MSRIILFLCIFAATVCSAGITVYPSAGGANLRVPVIPPAPGGAKGRAADFENVRFTYELAPHFQGSASGAAEFYLRDLGRRVDKSVIVLNDRSNRKLELLVPPASEGRGLLLRHSKHTAKHTVALERGKWHRLELRYSPGKAELTGENISLSVKLPSDFIPVGLTVYAAMVDEFKLKSGESEFVLDWEKDYAGVITPEQGANGGVSTALFGFDSHVISTDPTKRDCPYLQIINSSPQEREVKISYNVKSEINGMSQNWVQTCRIAAGSQIYEPLKFPFELKSDVYHLEARTDGNDKSFRHHFIFAESRGEKAGPGVFGLHDCNFYIFGGWPDAMPLRFAHKYLRWGYVVGPAWVKDWNGNYGLDPDTDPAEWNWNEKIDWEIASGREMFVCLNGTPLLDWQRARAYEKMSKTAWGQSGGFHELKRYAQFVHAAGERYKGKVHRWEVENEPNASSHMVHAPLDYVEVCKTVSKELKAVDPTNLVYGISGTSTFVPWIKQVLQGGAAPYLDAISWHTYTTPEQPERAGLADMLEDAKKAAAPYKINRFFNSETGLVVAQRDQIDAALPPEEVAKRIAEGSPYFVSKTAWPGRVNNEYQAAASMVKNATVNLVAGVEAFVFFGWNPAWPQLNPKRGERPSFGLFVFDKSRERTPSLAALGVAVLTQQFSGVVLDPAPAPTGSNSVLGGIFRKAGGGEVAMLWSSGPTGSALISATDAELEIVSVFGEKSILKPNSTNRFLLPLTNQPLYVHSRGNGMKLIPSPVDRITVQDIADQEGYVQFMLLNRGDAPWSARIRAPKIAGISFEPESAQVEISSKKRKNLEFKIRITSENNTPELQLPFAVELPGGGDYLCTVQVSNKPSLPIFTTGLAEAKPVMLDKVEQAVIGRPPQLASLQEDHYWGGREELSGQLKMAYDCDALLVNITAHDANLKLPLQWPGSNGSAIELFFDFRPREDGLGRANYGPGVYQILILPEAEGQPARFHCAQAPDLMERGVTLESKKLSPTDYSVTVRIPWRSVKLEQVPPVFGFDIGLNGSFPEKAGRKTQLMLYGTTANFRNASYFGTVRTK